MIRSDEHELDFELIVHASSWGEAQAIGDNAVTNALDAIQVAMVDDESSDLHAHIPSVSYVESLGTMLSYA